MYLNELTTKSEQELFEVNYEELGADGSLIILPPTTP